jgi:hypothetical protein
MLCGSLIFQRITDSSHFKLIKIKEPTDVTKKEGEVILKWKSLTF